MSEPIERIKYVVTFTPRSGSTMLSRLLSSHWQIQESGEFLNGMFKGDYQESGSPNEYLNRVFHNAGTTKASGGKVSGNHFKSKFGTRCVKLMTEATGIRIIHLRRRNLLRQFLSVLWHRRGVKNSTLNAKVTGSIEVDVREFLPFAEEMATEDKFLRGMFAKHESIDVWYEQLLRSQLHQERILAFLRVRDEVLGCSLEQLNSQTLDAAIANYAEVKEALTGTEHEGFLE